MGLASINRSSAPPYNRYDRASEPPPRADVEQSIDVTSRGRAVRRAKRARNRSLSATTVLAIPTSELEEIGRSGTHRFRTPIDGRPQRLPSMTSMGILCRLGAQYDESDTKRNCHFVPHLFIEIDGFVCGDGLGRRRFEAEFGRRRNPPMSARMVVTISGLPNPSWAMVPLSRSL